LCDRQTGRSDSGKQSADKAYQCGREYSFEQEQWRNGKSEGYLAVTLPVERRCAESVEKQICYYGSKNSSDQSQTATPEPAILDEIERGKASLSPGTGRAIARLIPEDAMRRDGHAEAVERLKTLRATVPRVPLDELLAMRHEGHRH
jgi:hypothetical protein